MSAKHTNVKKTPESDYKFDVAEGDQKARVTGSYKDAYEGWKTRCPLLKSPHPDDATMGLVKISAAREDGNVIKVSLEYESYTWEATYPGRPASDERIKRYDCELSTTEEPLLTNGRFAELGDGERVALANLLNGQETKEGGGSWADDVTSELGLHALAKVRKGISAYLEPGFVWIERYVTENLEDLEMTKCGEIMDPPGPRPAPGSERNYLYLGATASNTDDGEKWNVERKWRLSGKGKWDDLYYPEWTLEG